MKHKILLILIIFLGIINLTKAQITRNGTFDTSLQQLTDQLAEKLTKYNSLKMGVWNLSDLNGGVSPIGRYIADDIAVNLSDKFHIVNRNQLNTLIKENQLSAEGFINQATLRQVKKLSDIDVMITGYVSILSQNIKITLEALDVDGNMLAAVKGEVQRNADINELLGINTGASNRGFNRPLGSNEQYNNPQTVESDCAAKHTGDFCFFNSSKKILMVTVKYNVIPLGVNYPNYTPRQTQFVLKPGESKCLPDILAVTARWPNQFVAIYSEGPQNDPYAGLSLQRRDAVEDQGDFRVVQCKSTTYEIK